MEKLGKKFSVQFEEEIDQFLNSLAKEKRTTKVQLIRDLVFQGLIADKVDEARNSLDDSLEKIKEISEKYASMDSRNTRFILNILSQTTQLLLLSRRGVGEYEISKIKNEADEFLQKVQNRI